MALIGKFRVTDDHGGLSSAARHYWQALCLCFLATSYFSILLYNRFGWKRIDLSLSAQPRGILRPGGHTYCVPAFRAQVYHRKEQQCHLHSSHPCLKSLLVGQYWVWVRVRGKGMVRPWTRKRHCRVNRRDGRCLSKLLMAVKHVRYTLGAGCVGTAILRPHMSTRKMR